ncbi:MAG: PEP-CTERM sorting domain-containing protein [Sedimentisphaerales bacterium]|jgi:hypothetical protein
MKKLLTITIIVLAVSCLTQASVIVNYDFGSTYALRTLDPSIQAAHITGGSFSYTGDGSTPSYRTGSDGTGNSYGVDNGWDDSAYEDYFYFTVTIDNGWSFDVSSLQFDSKVSEMYGPENAKVTCLGASETTIESGINIWYSGWQYGSATNIADDSLPNGLTGNVTFRIYAKDTQMGYGGSFAVDNVILNGSMIPEPTTICMLGLGALSLIRRKK